MRCRYCTRRAFLKFRKNSGALSTSYIWRFVGGQPKAKAWKTHKRVRGKDAPNPTPSAKPEEARTPVCLINYCYALMQATGMVTYQCNCFRYRNSACAGRVALAANCRLLAGSPL